MLNIYNFGDINAIYCLEDELVRFTIVPNSYISNVDYEVIHKSSQLIQIMISGDKYPRDYSMGHTMLNSGCAESFRYCDQQFIEHDNKSIVKTSFTKGNLQTIVHNLTWEKDSEYLLSDYEYTNQSDSEQTIEYFASFILGSVNPFMNRSEDLILHRIRSNWSAEGKLCSESIHNLQMEPSWLNYGARVERYGQVGSMPVRKFYPFIGIEDKSNGVGWGAVNCVSTSWQMELYRKNEAISISGGLADYDFGHWRKTIPRGGGFHTPVSVITVTGGDIDEVCRRLVTYQKSDYENLPMGENNLPIIFNEFCTTWGEPSEQNLLSALDAVKNRGIRYFVIDAGWYRPKGEHWSNSIGDWNPNPELFPNGIKNVTENIRKAGLIPGIWFEFEAAAEKSGIYSKDDWMLKRNGSVLRLQERTFLDMRNEEVLSYLDEKVIQFMKENEFSYIKIDYNDTIGIGCDGAESLGEGLRQVIEGTKNFIVEIKKQIPEAVIEICASGGHRLEPAMLSLASMGSFSDAHECPEGPLIAGNMHRIIHPAKSQIWAVVHSDDSRQRLEYVLAGTFLGRFCLSGNVTGLDAAQWNIVDEAIAFYQSIVPIIRDGRSYLYGSRMSSYKNPSGWQAVYRVQEGKDTAVMIIHIFDEMEGSSISVSHSKLKGTRIIKSFGETLTDYHLEEDTLAIRKCKNFTSLALLLQKD